MNRRQFLFTGSGVPAAAGSQVPAYLKAYSAEYDKDPRAAAMAWFNDAKFGLFMHYGLYSHLARGEWVMLRERITVAEYKQLTGKFTAAGFDADSIAGLASAAGMKYITITAKHHDGFCLFNTRQTPYNSVQAAARRDLIAELAGACRKRSLGLCLYYSIAADWQHPWFPARTAGWESFRPAYDKPEPAYLWQKDEDTRKYIDYAKEHVRELLSNYGPVAAMWFDPVAGYYARPDLFPMSEIYAMVRRMQPQCLISFKQGATGEEDFMAPERGRVAHRMKAEAALRAWEKNKEKKAEICDTLQKSQWGHNASEDGKHKRPDDVMLMLENASKAGANLLLNTGPLASGAIPQEDIDTLREVGKRLRA
jgi:alpha-L-fucosidase